MEMATAAPSVCCVDVTFVIYAESNANIDRSVVNHRLRQLDRQIQAGAIENVCRAYCVLVFTKHRYAHSRTFNMRPNENTRKYKKSSNDSFTLT